jgi:hypothetical protein
MRRYVQVRSAGSIPDAHAHLTKRFWMWYNMGTEVEPCKRCGYFRAM